MEAIELSQELVHELETGRLLPEGVQARPAISDLRLSLPEGRTNVDLLVDFTITQTGRRVRAAIECKSRITPTELEVAVVQLRRIREKLRRDSQEEPSDLYLMVAAPYISESVRNLCKDHGLGYIDLNGNLYLAHGDIYLDILRESSQFRPPAGVKGVFSGKSRRVLRVLLSEPSKPYRLEDLAKEANTSVSQTYYVIRRLQEERFVEKTSQGAVLSRPGRLLKTMTSDVVRDYKKNRKVFFATSGENPDGLAHRLMNFCERKQLEHAFTLFSALEKQERNVFETLTALYVSRDPDELAAHLDLPFAARGGNVLLMCPPRNDNTVRGGVFHRPRQLSSGVTAVNLIQAYFDFMAYPGRGEEQANYIFERLLGFRE